MIGDMYGILSVYENNTTKLEEAAGLVRDLVLAHGIEHQNIVYDAGGWAGSEFATHLRALGIRNCCAYHGNDSGGTRHKNRRSLAGWRLRQRLDPTRPLPIVAQLNDPYRPSYSGAPQPQPITQPGFSIPRGPFWAELREELIALKFSYGESSKIALEDKSELTATLGRSPDLADTLLMMTAVWNWQDS
jgi:hypothetical protein